VLNFGTANHDPFPESLPAGQSLAVVAKAAAAIDAHATAKLAAGTEVRKAKSRTRVALKEQTKVMSRMVRGLALGDKSREAIAVAHAENRRGTRQRGAVLHPGSGGDERQARADGLLVAQDDAPGAVAIVAAALDAAPPGNAGWLIPIEPLLGVPRAHDAWRSVLSRLRRRAL
jgi:hypothetical protein